MEKRTRDRSGVYCVEDRDVRQVAVLLGVVEAVADDEAILDREADVLDLHVDLAARRLAEQARRAQRLRAAGAQDVLQVVSVRPVSTMSSTMTTCGRRARCRGPSAAALRRSRRALRVARDRHEVERDAAVACARTRSDRNMNAPLSTQTMCSAVVGVVARGSRRPARRRAAAICVGRDDARHRPAWRSIGHRGEARERIIRSNDTKPSRSSPRPTRACSTPGATVLLAPRGHVTPLADDTLRERRVTVVREDGVAGRDAERSRRRPTSGAWRSPATTPASRCRQALVTVPARPRAGRRRLGTDGRDAGRLSRTSPRRWRGRSPAARPTPASSSTAPGSGRRSRRTRSTASAPRWRQPRRSRAIRASTTARTCSTLGATLRHAGRGAARSWRRWLDDADARAALHPAAGEDSRAGDADSASADVTVLSDRPELACDDRSWIWN